MPTTDVRRDAADSDFFYEPRLRFGICRPAGWRFVQLPGAPGRRPFVAMVQDPLDACHPRPTIQASCRSNANSELDLGLLLEAQLHFLSRELPGFEKLTSSLDNIIGGCRAAHLQFRYTLHLPHEGGTWPAPMLAHNYLVAAEDRAFTIAMSSSADPLYYDESDFAAALSSVRIDSPEASLPSPVLDRSRIVGLTGTRRSRPASS